MFRSCSEIPAFTFTVFCRVRDCFSCFLLSVDETGGGGDDDVLTVFTSRMLCWSRNRTQSGAKFRISDVEHFKSDLHEIHIKQNKTNMTIYMHTAHNITRICVNISFALSPHQSDNSAT